MPAVPGGVAPSMSTVTTREEAKGSPFGLALLLAAAALRLLLAFRDCPLRLRAACSSHCLSALSLLPSQP